MEELWGVYGGGKTKLKDNAQGEIGGEGREGEESEKTCLPIPDLPEATGEGALVIAMYWSPVWNSLAGIVVVTVVWRR